MMVLISALETPMERTTSRASTQLIVLGKWCPGERGMNGVFVGCGPPLGKGSLKRSSSLLPELFRTFGMGSRMEVFVFVSD